MKRRIFLRGVAGAALAAPFLSSLDRGKARAADASSPKRLVIFYTQNGCIVNRWFPKNENGVVDAAALAGTTLEPLTKWASKLLVPRGLAMDSYEGFGFVTVRSARPLDEVKSAASMVLKLDVLRAEAFADLALMLVGGAAGRGEVVARLRTGTGEDQLIRLGRDFQLDSEIAERLANVVGVANVSLSARRSGANLRLVA